MAPSFDAVVAFVVASAADVTQSFTINASANLLYVVQIGDPSFQADVTTIQYGGESISTTPTFSSELNQHVRIFGPLINPPTGINDIFIDWAGTPSTMKFGAVSIIGGNTSDPDGAADATAASTGSSNSISPASTSDGLVIGFINLNGPPTGPATGDTERLNPGNGEAGDLTSAGLGIATAPGTGSPVTIDWSWSGNQRNEHIGFNLNAAAAGGATPKGVFGLPLQGPLGGPIG